MRFNLRISSDDDLMRMMLQEIVAAEVAVTRGVDRAQNGLKRDWRGQVRAAGLGSRLANAIRGVTYPSHTESIRAASLVYAQPGLGPGASAATVIDAHDKGALIRSQKGFWLAIPLDPKVQKMRAPGPFGGRQQHRITPSGWEVKTGRKLEFVPRKGRFPLLVDKGMPLSRLPSDSMSFQSTRYRRWVRGGRRRRKVWTPIFVLVPQTKLRRKLTLDEASDRWADQLPTLIVDNWKDTSRVR